MSDGAGGASSVLPFKMRERSRGDPVTSQRGMDPLEDGILRVRDALDMEIDAAVRESREVDYAVAFRTVCWPECATGDDAAVSDRAPEEVHEELHAGVEAIAALGDVLGKEELQLRVMHRLLVRHFPMASIAKAMGVSSRTAYRIREKLKKRHRQETKELDIQDYVGKSLYDYREWIADVLRIDDETKISGRDRLRVVKLANHIKASEINFLQLTGFFKAQPFTGGVDKRVSDDQEEIDETLALLGDIFCLDMDESIDDLVSDEKEIDATMDGERRASSAGAFDMDSAVAPLAADARARLAEGVPVRSAGGQQARADAAPPHGDALDKKEFQLRMMHRLLAKHLPMATIANVMEVPLRTAYRIRAKLKKRYRKQFPKIDINEYIGRALGDYGESIASVLRIADDPTTPLSDRLDAIKLANHLKTSEQRFLHRTGFFEAKPSIWTVGETVSDDQEGHRDDAVAIPSAAHGHGREH